MSYFVIMGPDDSRNFLCDYRPNIECPQWSGPINRAYKFPTRAGAEAFRQLVRKPWDLGMMRIVRVTTKADRRVERATLRAENERLRMVIQIGGAMYRAERASMGIPGLDSYTDPKPPAPPATSEESKR